MGKITIIVESDTATTKDLEDICKSNSWMRVLEQKVENLCGETPNIFVVPSDED